MYFSFKMAKNKYDIDSLNNHFGKQLQFSLDDLRAFFKNNDPTLPVSTICWRVHDLVNQSLISRIGYGVYQMASTSDYVPELSTRVLKISKYIKRNFPTTSYCAWDSGMINEFAQHLSGYPFILVDVDRDVSESVYFSLKDEFRGVFLRPSETLIRNLLPDFQLPIIVRYLTSESPLNQVNNIFTVSIEKLLVDIFCDIEFNYLAGSERRSVFSNAYYKYVVNENRLLRYAARKGRRPELHKYIQEGNFNKEKNNQYNP